MQLPCKDQKLQDCPHSCPDDTYTFLFLFFEAYTLCTLFQPNKLRFNIKHHPDSCNPKNLLNSYIFTKEQIKSLILDQFQNQDPRPIQNPQLLLRKLLAKPLNYSR